MPVTHNKYTQVELESVKRHLTDILSLDQAETAALVQEHPDDVSKLATLFVVANERHGQHWADALMAKLPMAVWEETKDLPLRILSKKSASMRFLSLAEPDSDALKLKDGRRDLHAGLFEIMDTPVRLVYRNMLEWVESDGLNPESSNYQLSAETVFGHTLEVIEGLQRDQVHIYEQNYRKNSGLDKSLSIPLAESLLASEKACEFVATQIEQMCVTETDVSSSVKESLPARVSANISVNRVLLEQAAIDARGLEAAEMTVPFLSRLNLHGMGEVPDDFHAAEDDGTAALKEILARMFGNDGLLAPVDEYFSHPMSHSDIDLIVNWSQKLQEAYITTRGMGGDWHQRGGKEKVEAESRAAHGTPCNRFIFALVIAAAFYEKAQTARELTGHSKSMRSIYPARGDAMKDVLENPPVHATELLKQAYGQIFYANEGWGVLAEPVENYARARSMQRAHIQQLLYFAVKNRSSRELFALCEYLQKGLVEGVKSKIPEKAI